jgi:peroxiredoxin
VKRNRAWVLAIAAVGISVHSVSAQEVHVGAKISDFAVQDLSGRVVRFSASGHVTVVAFISTRCPMSNAFNYRMNSLYNEFGARVRFVFLNSNSNESIVEVRHHAEAMGYEFPVYKDIDNAVADLLGAKATPDTFVIDPGGVMQYHGYIDDAPNPERVKNHGLRLAIEAVLDRKPVLKPETHSLGCTIRRDKHPEN